MRRLLLGVWLACASLAHAAGVSIELRDAPVPMFLDAVVRGVLGRDYVLSSAVSPDRRVSIMVRDIDKEKAFDLALVILRGQGLNVEDRDGILFVAPGSAPSINNAPEAREAGPGASTERGSWVSPPEVVVDVSWRVYRPHHRSVSFLSSIVTAMGGRVGAGVAVRGDSLAGGLSASGTGALSGSSYGGQSQSSPVVSAPDVLVYAVSEEKGAEIDKILAEVDVPSPAVQIRAVLVEVSDSGDSARSMSGALSLLAGRVGVSYQAGAAVVGGALTIKAGGLDAVLSMVDGDSRFRMVSQPRVQVVSGETASFTVGSEVPVRGQMTLTKDGSPLQSIEYRSGGLILSVTPQVYADSTVVKVDQQLSSFSMTTTSNIDSPTMLKRRLSSVVRAAEGDVVMLAGLDEERDSETHSGLSFLPRWAQSSSEQKSRSQLVLLLEVKR